jgi:anti-sigma-K factor RskA
MRLPRQDRHALTGAYALDAVEGRERDRFTRHLDRCRSCATEVRGFREVGTALALAVAVEPPPELRTRVMAAVARAPQEAASEPRPRSRPVKPANPARTWVPWLSGAVAMACVVLAVVFGLARAHTEQQLSQARAQNQAIAAVLAAPDARLIAQRTSVGGAASVVLDAARHKLVVVTSGLPSLRAGKVYQLWLMGPKKIVSAGLLPPASSGRTPPVLASGITAGDKLGLTVEPAPGSAQPTTTPILALPLPL